MIAVIKNEAAHPYAPIIYQIRTSHNLTREEFAECIGCSLYSVWGWESAKSTPNPFSVSLIRDAFPEFIEYEKKCSDLKVLDGDFPEVIKSFCKYKKINRTTFARTIGVPYDTVCNWVYGRNNPNYDYIMAIFKAFPDFEEWMKKEETND